MKVIDRITRCYTWSYAMQYVTKRVKLSSHMCDTTRHDSMRHDRPEDQDTTVFKFGATHTRHDHATRFCFITNSMTISWCTVDYQTFHKRIMLLQMKIRVKKDRNLSTQVFAWILNFLSKKTNPKVLVEF